MPLNSMTGFARGAGAAVGHNWNLEIKSVNNKGLDVRTRFPSFLEGFDLEVKKIVSGKLTRGSVFVSLNIEADENSSGFSVHEERLQALVSVAQRFSGVEGIEPASIDGLMAIKGIVEVSSAELADEDKKTLIVELKTSLLAVVKDLQQTRADEGKRMESFLFGQIDEIERLTQEAKQMSGNRIEAMNARFQMQLEKRTKTDKPVSDERLAQEIAVLAVKSDIQEEIDRLESHIEEARNLLSEKKPVGRRLDFLCQEFNRETNTLCSKSSDTKLTKVGLDLKTTIDQFREQIQNIE